MSERGSRLRRALDSWIGRPLILGMALARRRSRQPDLVEGIGLLMLAAIGDTILASAIIHDLRRAFPTATVTAFVSKANSGVADLLEGFDEVVLVPIDRPLLAVSKIRRRSFDVLIDIGQWAKASAIFAAASRARFTVGFKTPGQHRHWAFDAVAEHSRSRHEIDNFRALAACLGVHGHSRPRLRAIPDTDGPTPIPRPYIVLHPWASGYRSNMREWATASWVALADFILGSGFKVVITGGPADEARANALAAEIAATPQVIVTAGRCSLRDTAVVISRASAVVAVNTGTMHLAALLNRPMVALHGPTDPKRWGPLCDNAVVVGPGPTQGGAYLNLGFEYPRSAADCMARITPSEVIIHLRALLFPANQSLQQIEPQIHV